MEKEKYISPEMEIIRFEYEDVITASNPDETPQKPLGGIYYDSNQKMWFSNDEEE